LNDRRFVDRPILIETEKSIQYKGGAVVVDPYDVKNLENLRALRDVNK
jgi:hypothetical protein